MNVPTMTIIINTCMSLSVIVCALPEYFSNKEDKPNNTPSLDSFEHFFFIYIL